MVSSLMAGRKIRKNPDTMAGRIRGRVISFRDSRVGGAAGPGSFPPGRVDLLQGCGGALHGEGQVSCHIGHQYDP